MMVRDGPARRVMGPTIEVRRVHEILGATGVNTGSWSDRLWPRGIAKGALRIAAWAKDWRPAPGFGVGTATTQPGSWSCRSATGSSFTSREPTPLLLFSRRPSGRRYSSS